MPSKSGTKDAQQARGFVLLAIGRTHAGSVRLHFRPHPPLRSFTNHQRKLSALVYALAAELERRLDCTDAGWVVSPDPPNRRLDIEITEDGETAAAEDFLMISLAELGLGERLVRS